MLCTSPLYWSTKVQDVPEPWISPRLRTTPKHKKLPSCRRHSFDIQEKSHCGEDFSLRRPCHRHDYPVSHSTSFAVLRLAITMAGNSTFTPITNITAILAAAQDLGILPKRLDSSTASKQSQCSTHQFSHTSSLQTAEYSGFDSFMWVFGILASLSILMAMIILSAIGLEHLAFCPCASMSHAEKEEIRKWKNARVSNMTQTTQVQALA